MVPKHLAKTRAVQNKSRRLRSENVILFADTCVMARRRLASSPSMTDAVVIAGSQSIAHGTDAEHTDAQTSTFRPTCTAENNRT